MHLPLDKSHFITGSRSGGAFIAFSDIVLQQEGTVYGAVMQEDFSVCHIRAVNQTQRDEMKKAKYVQSNIEGIYLQVGQDLKKIKQLCFPEHHVKYLVFVHI